MGGFIFNVIVMEQYKIADDLTNCLLNNTNDGYCMNYETEIYMNFIIDTFLEKTGGRRLRYHAKSKKDYAIRSQINFRYNDIAEYNRKHRIYRAVNRALKSGKLVKPLICSICNGGKRRVVAHHEDYSKPLDVIWCCDKCHKGLHMEKIDHSISRMLVVSGA